MTGPRRAGAAAMVTVAVLLAVGCGGRGDGSTAAGRGDDGAAPGPPTGVPAALARGTLLATADLLVGLGVDGADGADLGTVVDLATGETWGLGRPDPEVPFSPGGPAVALDDALVVAGDECPPGSPRSDVEDPCSLPVTYRVDPRTATWARVAVPAGTDATVALHATAAGAVGVFRPSGAGAGPFELHRLGAGGWEPRGTVPSASPACATDDTLYSMVAWPGPPAALAEGYPEEATTTWTMTATALADGTTTSVALPDLPRFFATAAVTLACGPDAPVLAGTDAETWASAVRVWDGGAWREVAGVAPAPQEGTVRAVAGGDAAVVVVVRSGVGPSAPSPPDLDPPTEAVAVRADGTTLALLDEARDVTFVSRGVRGAFVAVGPTHEDAPAGIDEPPLRDPLPIALLPPTG